MRIGWLTPRINLSLSVLSVTLAYVGAFTLGAYMLVLLTVPAVVLFVLSLRRDCNVPVPKDRHLGSDIANALVRTAVEPREYPFCAHLSVMHSNGVAIAALIARATFTSIKHMQKILIQRSEEMQGEILFTKEVVIRHLKRLRRIQSMASGLVTGGNLQNRCFSEIPGAADICDALHHVRKTLEHDVIEKTEHFYASIPDELNNHKDIEQWNDSIRNHINVEVPSILTGVLEVLYKAENPASELVTKLETDWQKDLRFIWDDDLCKPCPEPIPDKQIRVPNFLYSEE